MTSIALINLIEIMDANVWKFYNQRQHCDPEGGSAA